MVLLLSLLIATASDSAQGCFLPSFASYRLGSPVLVSFEYAGDLPGWDGWIVSADRFGEKRLGVANGAILVVTMGLGPFEAPPGDTLKYWQTLSGPRGTLVAPIGDRVRAGVSYNVALTAPFRTLVDLSDYYDLSEPGIYTVYWGQEGLCTREVMFEIVPADAPLGSEGEQVNMPGQSN